MTHHEQPDLDTMLAEIEAKEAKRKAKAEKAGDPHAMQKAIIKAFAKVDRQRRLDEDRPHVQIKTFIC
jgi:hypothetical protein